MFRIFLTPQSCGKMLSVEDDTDDLSADGANTLLSDLSVPSKGEESNKGNIFKQINHSFSNIAL